MFANQASSPVLKVSTVTAFISLRSVGTRLNNLAPFTWRDDSLAFLTAAAAVVAIGGTVTSSPLLTFYWNGKWLPVTRPWESFQINVTYVKSY